VIGSPHPDPLPKGARGRAPSPLRERAGVRVFTDDLTPPHPPASPERLAMAGRPDLSPFKGERSRNIGWALKTENTLQS